MVGMGEKNDFVNEQLFKVQTRRGQNGDNRASGKYGEIFGSEDIGVRPTYHNLKEVVQEVVDRIGSQSGKPEIETGCKVVDEGCFGITRGQIMTIAARPGEGKTALVSQIAYHVAHKFKTCFISLEMTVQEVVSRLMCAVSGIDYFWLRRTNHHEIPDSTLSRIGRFVGEISSLNNNFRIVDDYGFKTNELERLLDIVYAEKPVVVFLDHLQHIRADNTKTLEALNNYLNTVKEFSKIHKIAFVILSQINREAHNSKPTLAHLKGSGMIEEVSDTVILISHDRTKLDENNVTLNIAKNRYGPIGEQTAYFYGPWMRFFDSYQHFIETQRLFGKTVNLFQEIGGKNGRKEERLDGKTSGIERQFKEAQDDD